MYFEIEYIKNGKVQKTVIKANSMVQALEIFRKKKLGIFKSVKKIEKKTFINKIFKDLSFSRVNIEELLSVFDQMYVLLNAGIGIDDVLKNIMTTIKDKKLKKVFQDIYYNIQAGSSLYNAFSRYEDYFGNLVISIIKLGEESGDLANALKDLATILQEILDNRKRLKKATRYPVFIIFAMVVAFIVVILFVIPPFKDIFAQLKTELPLPTRFLLWIEGAVRKFGPYILTFGISGFVILSFLYKKYYHIKLLFDKLILRIYIVGDVIELAMKGRFMYVFERLLESGIPIIDALDNAINIVDNEYLKNRLKLIKSSIQKGGSITQGFEDTGLFENMIIQMVKAGEESGNLIAMLSKISRYYLDKYRYLVDNIAVLIEPILIAAIAGFVITLALGIFLPMWNLTEAIK
ncbi:type II secretion system F family protein [Caminibacter sp.]